MGLLGVLECLCLRRLLLLGQLGLWRAALGTDLIRFLVLFLFLARPAEALPVSVGVGVS